MSPIIVIDLHSLLKSFVQLLEVKTQLEAKTVAFGGKFDTTGVQINDFRFGGVTFQDRQNVCESIIYSKAQVIQVQDKSVVSGKWGDLEKLSGEFMNAKAITRSITEKDVCPLSGPTRIWKWLPSASAHSRATRSGQCSARMTNTGLHHRRKPNRRSLEEMVWSMRDDGRCFEPRWRNVRHEET